LPTPDTHPAALHPVANNAALVWLRRDLRIVDHAALHAALSSHPRVWCAFVFDSDLLDALRQRPGLGASRRVVFILAALAQMDRTLRQHGSALIIRHGSAAEAIPRLALELGVTEVVASRDAEPAAIARDAAVAAALEQQGIAWRDCKDQVVFERSEVMSQAGTPFSVFTPYRNAWLRRLAASDLAPHDTGPLLDRLAPVSHPGALPTLAALGFADPQLNALPMPLGMEGAQHLLQDFSERIDAYADKRDFPALKGPSYLSPHLRFGTVSVRQLAALAHGQGGRGAETWLSELVWREFYQMILWHRPHVVERSFKPAFDALTWDHAPDLFAAWCEGRTGYPLVDAAMRQLNQTGWMHNRLRMVTASFLTKDLGIHWRDGAQYFADQLIDHELAANNGGWQWAASTGCDAQPWFRIFNPVTQSEKFDPAGKFIRRYVPELAAVPDKFLHAPWRMDAAEQSKCGVVIGRDYPQPVVDHAVARARTLERFGKLKSH
jgi:deoxyribodipyrimidine photo-lyase